MRASLSLLSLLIQLGTTLPLVGLVWMVQVVSYPQFANVGASSFTSYHAAHARLITWVVAPLMLGELIASFAWVLTKSDAVPRPLGLLGLALTLFVWLVTATIAVPYHNALADGFSQSAHRMLVSTNWLRTSAWTLRGALLLWVVMKMLTEAADTSRTRTPTVGVPASAEQGSRIVGTRGARTRRTPRDEEHVGASRPSRTRPR